MAYDQLLPDYAGAVFQGYDQGKERKQRSNLEALMGDYFQQGQASPDLLSGIARNGGNAAALQQNDQKNIAQQVEDVARYGQMFLALPDEQKAAAYPQFAQMVSAMKMPHPPIPPNYDPSFLPGMTQFVQAMSGGQGTGVQSSFVDAQGNRVAIMRDGSTQILGQNAPNMRPIAGDGGYYGFDPRTNTASPTMVGGGAPPQGMRQAVQFDFAPGTPQSVMDATRAYAMADQQGGGMMPTQLQPPAKPEGGSDETFSQPQEVMGPNGPVLVQFGNRGTMRPVQGYGVADNAQSANKEAMQRERMVAQLSKRLADEQVPLVDTQLNAIEGSLRQYTDPKGNVTKDIPGYGRLDSLVPDMVASPDAVDLRQQVQSLANVILKSRSGAAVTDNELRRFLVEAGTGKLMPEGQLVKGVRLMRNWFNAQKNNIRGGYAPEVVQSYYDNAPENSGLLGAPPAPVQPAGAVEWVRGPDGKLRRK